jgi:PKD repeat protein
MRCRMNNRFVTIFAGLVATAAIGGCADPVAPPSDGTTTSPPPPTNSAPAAVFSTNCTLLDCSFDASASTDSDGSVDVFSWDFGDGSSDAAVNPAHSYAAAGDYIIALIITDDDGATADSSQSLTVVSAGNNNNPPTASFSSSCVDLICNFDAGASTDSDGSVVSYDWNYGNGVTGTGQTSAHNFATAGTYTINLTVTDNLGSASSSSQELSVTSGGAAPDGNALFTQKCSTCHGADALGGTLAKISIVGKTAQEITDAIMSVPNMSSLNNLTTDEIQAIADYLATL